MASFLLSQPTGFIRETFYILGQAGSLTRTAVARSCLGEVRWRAQNEADLSPGLKEPDGKSMDGTGICIEQLPDLPWTDCKVEKHIPTFTSSLEPAMIA